MTKVRFKYYLHDNSSSSEFAEFVHPQIKNDVSLSEEEISRIVDKPFYEVELLCELDTETGEVVVISATG